MTVRKGCKYRFVPVPLDRIFGDVRIQAGEIITAGPVPGLPFAKTVNAGHVHVYLADGTHAGFVHVNSLERIA